jgi:cysteine desulfurase
MITHFKSIILDECRLISGEYEIMFTSGEVESSCYFITMTARGYIAKTKKIPHIIISNLDHPLVIQCCECLVEDKLCSLTILMAASTGEEYGTITSRAVANAIRVNTCAISIPCIDIRSGIKNNIDEIHAIANKASIPFHTDATALFCQSAVRVQSDAFSANFQSMGGPTGIGILVIKRILITGYGMRPLINGDVLNIPVIGASYRIYQKVVERRSSNIKHLSKVNHAFKAAMSSKFKCANIDQYAPSKSFNVYWVEPRSYKTAPNTVLLAISNFNASILVDKKIIVGTPHVPYIAGMNDSIFRVSFSSTTSDSDVLKLVDLLFKIVHL